MPIAPRGRLHRQRTPVGATARVALVALVAAVLLVAACQPPAPPPAGWFQSYVTRDHADELWLHPTPKGVDVRPKQSNGLANTRTVFGRTGVPVGVDGTSCATARQSGWPAQEGVALRIHSDTVGGVPRTRAVTVTRNIWLMLTWIYNVHVWDTSNPNGPMTQIASIDLSSAIPDGDSDLVPRRMCARVTGRQLELKVWHPHRDEPDWGDRVHTAAVTLPARGDHAGRPGWYAGHVPVGGSISLTDLVAQSVPK